MRIRKIVTVGAILASTAMPAFAADLTIGRATEPSSIDPQFSRTGNNQMTAELIFGRLVEFGPNLELSPGLATSWEALDDTTWQINLREGVTFHDGSPLTADDVMFSLERTDEVPNSPAPFSDMVSNIAAMDKVDDLTFKITTRTPAPRLIEDIGRVFIVSKTAAEGATSEDFNSGQVTIGTGPYVFESWTPGETLQIQAYDGYWGEKPDFADVDVRFISNDAARVAALLSGEVDLIDAVPPTDVPRLSETEGIRVISAASGRVVYLGLSMRFDEAPEVTDLDGNPLGDNPFRDARVRKAVSHMIDRALLVDRILGGSGVPAGQLVPNVLGGHAQGLEPDPYDPEKAKQLLAEAGYPDGFGITVYSSNNRLPGDADVGQALGQMLARGGLQVNGIRTLPYNIYAKAASAGDYSVFVFSLGSSTPSSAPNLMGLIHSHDKATGKGPFNRVRYANAHFDAALEAAMQEFDTEKRNELLADATRLAFAETPIVPLYWQKVHWAMKDEIAYDGGLSEATVAQNVTKVE